MSEPYPIYHIMGDGKFPMRDGNPVLITEDQYKCCCCHPTEITKTQSGLNEPSGTGWQNVEYDPSTKILSGQFVYENADNESLSEDFSDCGGDNYDRQKGTASLYVCFDHDVKVEGSVSGDVETYTSGFDRGRVYADGTLLAHIESTEDREEGCEMEPAEHSGTSAKIDAWTPFEILFSADTGDWNWHKDMIHTFEAKVGAYTP